VVSKKIGIVVVLVAVVLIIAALFWFTQDDEDSDDTNGGSPNGENGEYSTEHTIIYSTGENGFPKIDGGHIYWTNFDNNSIFQYNINTGNIIEHSIITDANYTLNDIYPSGDYITCKLYHGEGFNVTTEYFIYDISDHSFDKLYIDAWGVSFDYPYVVYHIVGIAGTNLYLFDVTTNTTQTINLGSWGRVDGDYVVYVNQKKAHLYQISTEEDIVIMETEKTLIDIVIAGNKCLLIETEDMGQDAVSTIHIYQIDTGELKEVGDHNDFMYHEEFDGRYLFWSESGTDADVMVMDTDTKVIKTMASGQWIASLATGTLSAEDKTVVWASNFEIHMGRVIN
jgi:hypothetical protein